MNRQQEDELILHVAAGADLLTAIAALPREDESPNEPRPVTSKLSSLIWAILAFAVMLVASLVIP